MLILSIIIPHKNIPHLLKRCLDSIPDIDEIQVIIVDDNSDENVVDFNLFPGLERNNVVCVFDKKGGGAGYARNIGLKHADGKWLLFADADDFFVQNFYGIVKSYEKSDSQMILFKAKSVFSDTLEPCDRYNQLNIAIDKALSGEYLPQEVALDKPGPVSRMVKRSFVMTRNILFDETLSANDMMFVAKATCWAEKVEVSEQFLYVVTQRSGSLMSSTMQNPDNYLCRLRVMIEWNKFLDDYNQYRHFRLPIIVYVWRARKINIKTFFRAFLIAVKNKALFSGFAHLMRTVKRHLHLSK